MTLAIAAFKVPVEVLKFGHQNDMAVSHVEVSPTELLLVVGKVLILMENNTLTLFNQQLFHSTIIILQVFLNVILLVVQRLKMKCVRI